MEPFAVLHQWIELNIGANKQLRGNLPHRHIIFSHDDLRVSGNQEMVAIAR